MEINKDKIYSTLEIMDAILLNNPSYKSSSLYNKINELENNGVITRIGKSKYVYKTLKSFSYDFESNIAKRIYKHMKSNYAQDFEFVIYENTVVLNQFLNHLITSPLTILEVPKYFMEHVFISLKEAGFKNILVNPSKEDLYRYNESTTIIIHPLISKSPFNKKENKITIEKITVDIVCDPLLRCFYEGSEVPNMVEEILLHYKVKYDTLKNYAKRRHAYDELIRYVPEEMEEMFDD